VIGVLRDFDQPPDSYPFGPYPADRLTYKGEALVEYRTPPRRDGLGTRSWLEKNESPIDGAVMAIVAQFERDAARFAMQ
jgi:hypothetical protein